MVQPLKNSALQFRCIKTKPLNEKSWAPVILHEKTKYMSILAKLWKVRQFDWNLKKILASLSQTLICLVWLCEKLGMQKRKVVEQEQIGYNNNRTIYKWIKG